MHISSSMEQNLTNIHLLSVFFKDIIGVTHEKAAKVEKVVIHTKTGYQHGLILTKPLHHFQTETLSYGEHPDGNMEK